MKDCSPCPLFETCHTKIVEKQASVDAVNAVLKGIATLHEQALEQGRGAVTEKIDELGGVASAIYLHEDGGGDVDKWLLENPETATQYHEVITKVEGEIAWWTVALGAVQETCKGPKHTRRFILFGEKMVECTTQTKPTEEFTNQLRSNP